MIDISKALDTRGFMEPNELRWLAERASESSIIIEVGSYYGRSTRALADNTKGVVYSIDPYPGVVPNTYGKVAIASGNYVRGKFLENLNGHVESGKVVPFRGDFPTFYSNFSIEPDFIFIDGDHLFEPFRKDLFLALSLRPKVLSGHDYGNPDWPAVKELVDFYIGPDNIETVGGIWIRK